MSTALNFIKNAYSNDQIMFLKCFNDMDNPEISHTIWMTASIKPYYGQQWPAVYIICANHTSNSGFDRTFM